MDGPGCLGNGRDVCRCPGGSWQRAERSGRPEARGRRCQGGLYPGGWPGRLERLCRCRLDAGGACGLSGRHGGRFGRDRQARSCRNGCTRLCRRVCRSGSTGWHGCRQGCTGDDDRLSVALAGREGRSSDSCRYRRAGGRDARARCIGGGGGCVACGLAAVIRGRVVQRRRAVLGYPQAQHLAHFGVTHRTVRFQPAAHRDVPAGAGRVDGAGDAQFGVRGGECLFVVGQQLLEEFLARAQAGEGDGDLGLGVAGQAHHGAGQVHDADGLAHVEHEGLATASHQAGLQHELGGLGDGHEIAGDVGVGDGDGAAVGDLFAELGDDAAAGAQHVAEAHEHHGQGGHAVLVLQDHLGQPLGGAHDVGGVHRLVAGDVDEAFDVEAGRHVGQHAGAEGVVAHGLPGVVFFQDGNVLVGGGVVDDGRPVVLEDFFEAGAVLDVADDGDDLLLREGAFQVFGDAVEGEFAQLEDDQLARLEAGDLAAEFGADGAAAAGDQHGLALDHVAQATGVEADGVAAQQVVHVHIADLRDLDLPAHQLLHVGDDEQLDVGAFAHLEHAAAGGVVGGAHGQHGVLAVAVAGDLFELLPVAQDAHAAQLSADLVGVVVQHADDVPVRVAVEVVDEREGGVARAQQDDGLGFDALGAHGLFLPPAVEQAPGAHEEDEQQRVEEVDGAGHAQAVAQQQQQDGDDDARHPHRQGDEPHVVDGGVAPDALVEPEVDETPHLYGQRDRQGLEQDDLRGVVQLEIPAQREGECPDQCRHDDVVADGNEGPGIDVEQSHVGKRAWRGWRGTGPPGGAVRMAGPVGTGIRFPPVPAGLHPAARPAGRVAHRPAGPCSCRHRAAGAPGRPAAEARKH